MDKKSKILLISLLVMSIFSISVAYHRSFIAKDFMIITSDEEGTLEQ